MVSLDQLLLSRDHRVAFQQDWLRKHPGCALVTLTVQLPGPEKRNELSLTIGKAGLEALQQRFPGCLVAEKDLETGYEAYFSVGEEALSVKNLCCEVEESHPLGRLMDIDVLGADGPVSRQAVGREPRRCLLCGNEVRYCMRAKTHTREELLARIRQMVNEYPYAIQKTNPGGD